MDETLAAQFVMMEVRTCFKFMLPNGLAAHWVRAVKLCKDQEQAKRLVRRLVDEGKMDPESGISAFRALLGAETPWTTAGPIQTDYTQFKGAAAKFRDQVVASGDARLKAVIEQVDCVRAAKPLAWHPLTEDEQQARKRRIIEQLHALDHCALPPSSHDQGVKGMVGEGEGADRASMAHSAMPITPVFDPPSPLNDDLPF